MADRFMLLLRGDERDWATLSPDDIQRVMARYNAWSDELRAAGHEIVSAEALSPSTSALLSLDGDAFTVVDGPYAETKEGVGGFWVITARDRAEAIEVAKGCPVFLHGGTVEVVGVDPDPS